MIVKVLRRHGGARVGSCDATRDVRRDPTRSRETAKKVRRKQISIAGFNLHH